MSRRAWITFTVLCLIWGAPYFFIKLALTDLSPACVAWGRIALGAAILTPIAWHRGVLRPVLEHKRAVCAFAIAELTGPFSLIAFGEQWVSSSLAGILIATAPLTMVLIAPLFGIHERLGVRRGIGMLIGFVGVATLLGFDTGHDARLWWGVACVGLAVVGYAIGPLIVQRHLHDVDELGSLAASLVVATVLLSPLAFFTAPTHMPSLLSLGSVAILGTFCTALALLLFFYLIKEAGASRSSIVAYVNPAVAAVLGVLILHEPFGVASALGLGMILVGSWLATHKEAVGG